MHEVSKEQFFDFICMFLQPKDTSVKAVVI